MHLNRYEINNKGISRVYKYFLDHYLMIIKQNNYSVGIFTAALDGENIKVELFNLFMFFNILFS